MKIVKFLFRIVLVIAIVVFVILGIVRTPNHQCTSMQVKAHAQNESVLLTQNDVEKILNKAGIKIVGEKMKTVDLKTVTEVLSQNPYIEKINFVHFSNSKLIIDYTLKHIILHVYSENGDQYFVDENGTLSPYTSKMKDYLIIANGNIHQNYKKGASAGKELTPVVNLAKMILDDDFYTSQFRQIYLNNKQQMELVATVGNQIILFGKEDNAEEKLTNLKELCKNGLPRMGFDQYAQLDVRYKNKIIAKRK
ncbi:MAG: hypothetical protein MJZ57_02740 [Bacteroidales bacterium]|nr:hypothetical protein [Bacteroidales bacterium]